MGPLGAVSPVPAVTGSREKKERIHSGQLSVTFDSPSGLTTFLSSYVKSQLCPWYPLLPCCCPLCQTCVTLSQRALASGLKVFWFQLVYFLSTEKENPYEDVDLKRKSLGRKLDTTRSWTAMDKKQSAPPQVSSSLRSSKCPVPFVFLSVGGTLLAVMWIAVPNSSVNHIHWALNLAELWWIMNYKKLLLPLTV